MRTTLRLAAEPIAAKYSPREISEMLAGAAASRRGILAAALELVGGYVQPQVVPKAEKSSPDPRARVGTDRLSAATLAGILQRCHAHAFDKFKRKEITNFAHLEQSSNVHKKSVKSRPMEISNRPFSTRLEVDFQTLSVLGYGGDPISKQYGYIPHTKQKSRENIDSFEARRIGRGNMQYAKEIRTIIEDRENYEKNGALSTDFPAAEVLQGRSSTKFRRK